MSLIWFRALPADNRKKVKAGDLDLWLDTAKIEAVTVLEPNKTAIIHMVSGTKWLVDHPAQNCSYRVDTPPEEISDMPDGEEPGWSQESNTSKATT